MMQLDMQADAAEEVREPNHVRMWRSLRVKIDKDRADTRQSFSEWMQEAAEEKLARKGKP
jgi:accessory colonization factor AcfC